MATVRSDPKAGGKRAAVAALYAMASLVVATGLGFAAYSWVYRVNYAVFSMEIPGYVFAAFVVFLGIRYILSVRQMSRKLASF